MLSSKQKKCVELMVLGDIMQREILKQINIKIIVTLPISAYF